MAQSLGSFSSGFWDDIDQQREENRRLEDQRSANERSVLTALLQSKDPKLQTYALSGMLDAAQPKRHMKGIAGLLGEMEANPAIQQIHNYLQTPQTTVTHGLPSTNLIPTGPTSPGPARPDASSEGGFTSQGPLPAAPKQGAAAMPTSSPVTGGALRPPSPPAAQVGQPPPVVPSEMPPPPGLVPGATRPMPPPPGMTLGTGSPMPPPPGMGAAAAPPPPGVIRQEHAGPAVGRTDTTYPQAFYTPEEEIRKNEISRVQAKVEGMVAGYEAVGVPHDQAVAQAKLDLMREHGAGANFGGVTQGAMLPPDTLDVYGRPVSPNQNYRTILGPHGPEYHPVISSAAQAPLKVFKMPNGKRGLYRVNPDNSREFVGEVPVGAKYMHVTKPDGSQEVFEVPGDEGGDVTPSPAPSAAALPAAAAAGANAPPTAGTTAPPPQQAGTPVPAGQAAAATPPPGAGTAPVAAPVTAGGVTTPAGVHPLGLQTHPPTFTNTTVKKADGQIGPALKTHDGSFVSADSSHTPLPGAVEVPASANLEKPISAQAKKDLETIGASEAMIQRVKSALDKGKLGLDPNEGYIHQGMEILGGYGKKAAYSAGFGTNDPVYQELIPLVANLRVLATSPYLRGIRNMQYVSQIQQHIPDVTDSPLLIRQKLAQQEQTFKDMTAEIRQAEGMKIAVPNGGGLHTNMPFLKHWAATHNLPLEKLIADKKAQGYTIDDEGQ